MTLPERDWEAAVDVVRSVVVQRAPIVLAAHVNPDADSLGSALALGLALRRAGGAVAVSFAGAPFAVPSNLAFLPGQDLLVPPEQVDPAPALLVTLDSASPARLASLAPTVEKADCVLVIDHHASNTRFGTLCLVDARSAATTVLVAGLVDRLGIEVDRDIAAALYAGLATDTGSFKYPATTPEVHHLAARLLRTGIRHDLISRALWDTHSFAYLRLLGDLLLRARLEPEADLVWTWCARDDLTAAGLAFDEVEGVIDVVRTAAEAEVAAVCKQDVDWSWQVSVRAKGALDVGAVCAALGGGGHGFAAGFTSRERVDVTMARLRAALAEAPRLPT